MNDTKTILKLGLIGKQDDEIKEGIPLHLLHRQRHPHQVQAIVLAAKEENLMSTGQEREVTVGNMGALNADTRKDISVGIMNDQYPNRESIRIGGGREDQKRWTEDLITQIIEKNKDHARNRDKNKDKEKDKNKGINREKERNRNLNKGFRVARSIDIAMLKDITLEMTKSSSMKNTINPSIRENMRKKTTTTKGGNNRTAKEKDKREAPKTISNHKHIETTKR